MSSLTQRVRDWLFGDHLGLVVFLGALCFGMVFWRSGAFINDNVTLARTLEALSEGRVWIERAEGEFLRSPGTNVRDGRVYGRNYGQLVVSLPALVLVRTLDAVANLRVALFASIHLAVLALVVALGGLFDRRRLFALLGGPLVLGSFLLNVVIARQRHQPLDTELVALQITALFATAFAAVVLYRLVALERDRRVAALVGVGSVVALPVGLWAPVAKRHAFSVLVCVAVLFLIARSHRSEGRTVPVLGQAPVFRAGAYAAVGFLTWIHAAEGLFVFLALVAVDVPTARDNSPRSLAVVAGVFALSLVPVLVTNLLVAGTPFRPPREIEPQTLASAASTLSGSGLRTAGLSLGSLAVLGGVTWLVSEVIGLVTDSLAVLTEPARLYHIFVRSAGADLSTPRFESQIRYAGANLSVLESAPLLGAGVAVTGAWLARVRAAPRRTLAGTSPTTVLAVVLCIAYLLLYLSRLPLFTQFTQRYLLPVYPVALYLFARSPVVEKIVDETGRLIHQSYALGVLVGGQLFIGVIVAQDVTISEAAQYNARLSLATAALLGVVVATVAAFDRFERPAAVTIGLAGAASAVFVVAAGLYYFVWTGEAILPVVQTLSDLLESVVEQLHG
jgi:NADH:ubiquinone oxidoreductase subunit K